MFGFGQRRPNHEKQRLKSLLIVLHLPASAAQASQRVRLSPGLAPTAEPRTAQVIPHGYEGDLRLRNTGHLRERGGHLHTVLPCVGSLAACPTVAKAANMMRAGHKDPEKTPAFAIWQAISAPESCDQHGVVAYPCSYSSPGRFPLSSANIYIYIYIYIYI